MFRICRNPTTEWLRKTYRAMPLRVPEKRYQPMRVLSFDGNEATYIGELKYLFPKSDVLEVDMLSSEMSDASLEQTTCMALDVGLGILNGFFKALKMDPINLSSAFNRVKEISFSFTDVTREYVDLLQLGNVLSSNAINTKNPALDMFRNNEDLQMLLLTDAITSKGFSINDHTKGDYDLNIDIPLIEKYIADGKLNVKLGTDKKSSVSFKGDEARTFAFACAVIDVDWDSGNLSIQELFNPRGALESQNVNSKDVETHQLNYKKMLDDDENEPALLSIN